MHWDYRLVQTAVHVGEPARSMPNYLGPQRLNLRADRVHVQSLALAWKACQPMLRARQRTDRAGVAAALDVVPSNRQLQNAVIEISDSPWFRAPRGFERLMRVEKSLSIEAVDALMHHRRERLAARRFRRPQPSGCSRWIEVGRHAPDCIALRRPAFSRGESR